MTILNTTSAAMAILAFTVLNMITCDTATSQNLKESQLETTDHAHPFLTFSRARLKRKALPNYSKPVTSKRSEIIFIPYNMSLFNKTGPDRDNPVDSDLRYDAEILYKDVVQFLQNAEIYYVVNRFLDYDEDFAIRIEHHLWFEDGQNNGFSIDIDDCAELELRKVGDIPTAWNLINFMLINIKISDEMISCGIEMAMNCIKGKMAKCQKLYSQWPQREIFFEIDSPYKNMSLHDNPFYPLTQMEMSRNTTILIREAERKTLSNTTKIDTRNWKKLGRSVLTNLSYYGHSSHDQLLVRPTSVKLSDENSRIGTCGRVSPLSTPSSSVNEISFSRDNFGVSFHQEFMRINRYSVYGADDLQPFIGLIATKFSNIFTSLSGREKKYWDVIPIAVAKYNKDKSLVSGPTNISRLPTLQVFLEVELENDFKSLQSSILTKVDTANAVAASANRIFNKTVPYILLKSPNLDDFNRNFVFTQILLVKQKSSNTVNLGVSFNLSECKHIYPVFLYHVSFVLFREMPKKTDIELGVEQFFRYFKDHIQFCLKRITFYGKFQMGFITGWPDIQGNGKRNVTAFAWFWNRLNEWTVEQNLTLFVDSAFDEPRSNERRHTGWWKFVEDRPCYGSTTNFLFLEKYLQPNISDTPIQVFPSDNNTSKIIILANQRVHPQLLPEEGPDNPNGLHSLFNRDTFGVALHLDLLEKANQREYTENDVDYLVNLVHTRFSRVMINIVRNDSITSLKPERLIPLVAAKINRKIKAVSGKGMDKRFEIFVPFHITQSMFKVEYQFASFQVARKIADEANAIFPQTVNYLLMDVTIEVNFVYVNRNVNRMWHLVKKLKEEQHQHGNQSIYRVGVIYDLSILDMKTTTNEEIVELANQTISHVDALFLRTSPEYFGENNFQLYKDYVQKLGTESPNMTIGLIYQIYDTPESFASNPYRLVEFWQNMSRYSLEDNTPVFMVQAFDNAHKQEKSGWWSTTNIRNTNEYRLQEKYQAIYNRTSFRQDKVEDNNPGGSAPMAMGLVLTISLFAGLLMVAGVGLLIYSIKYRRDAITGLSKLSPVELLEFLEGRNQLGESTDMPMRLGNAENDCTEITRLFANYSYDPALELEEHTFTLDEASKLGSGAFGQVCMGQIRVEGNERRVAVKRVSTPLEGDGSLSSLRCLLIEIKVMGYIGRHDNVVALLGAHTGNLSKGELFAFLELCSRGSLQKSLKNLRNLETDPYTCLEESVSSDGGNLLARWSLDIARGMEFLASKHVVHADLATRNVLLDSNNKAKICDFGLARRMMNHESYVRTHQVPIPWRWMPPESIRCSVYNEKSDVWSFGVTMWEIYTLGDNPFAGTAFNVDFACQLEDGLRLSIPKKQNGHIGGEICMYPIMQRCWETDPSSRPKFQELVNMLTEGS